VPTFADRALRPAVTSLNTSHWPSSGGDLFATNSEILRGRPRGRVLVQIVVANRHEQMVLAGLSALLKTVSLENPGIAGQLILVPDDMKGAELAGLLQKEKSGGPAAVVKDLRGRDIGVAEQQLHHAQVRAVIEQMRGERMAQRVRRERRRLDARQHRVALERMPEGLPRRGRAPPASGFRWRCRT